MKKCWWNEAADLKFAPAFHGEPIGLPDRLMAGQLILVQFMLVRIQLGQPKAPQMRGFSFYVNFLKTCSTKRYEH